MSKRFTKRLIFYHLIKDISILFLVFFYLSSFITFNDGEEIIVDTKKIGFILVIGIIGYIVSIIYHYLYYKTSSYSFNEQGIVCEKGVFFKKKSFLEYNKVHTVNKKQNFIQQIFGIGFLLIDSGATSNAFDAEIKIIEEKTIIDELMKKIKNCQENAGAIDEIVKEEKEELENLYCFTSKSKIIYSLINSVTSVLVIICGTILVGIVLPILKMLIIEIEIPIIQMGLGLLGTYVMVLFFSFIGTIVQSFISYYDFGIYKRNNTIEISYGLFVKNSNSFHIDRIKAVKIKQSLIKRIFGFVSIDVEVIGYGNMTSNEKDKVSNVFIPLCKTTQASEYIEKIIGEEYVPVNITNGVKQYFPLVSWNCLVTTLICLLPAILCAPWLILLGKTLIWTIILIMSLIVCVFINVIILINAILKYHHEGIGITDNKICITHGGFNTQTSIFLKRHVIAVEACTTPLRYRKGIYSYLVHFRNNAISNEIRVDILGDEVKEALINSVRF